MRIGRRQRQPDGGDTSRSGQTGGAGEAPAIDGYTSLSVIGHGGSATVYRATQDGYDRQVAIKVLHVDTSNRKAQRRFTSERALNGRLSDHPNVVTVLDSGFVDGRYPYLAMEYFEHGSLADRVSRHGPLDVERVLHIGVRVAGALESAHRLGIVHRDVKPLNILLSRYSEPALADFGIATMLEREHSVTSGLTPVHAPPEVLEGADPTASADIYSLGSTLYTLLAGTAPFAGPTGEGMLAQLLRITTSDLPSMARSDVPVSLVEALRVATAKQPNERFASAAAFGRSLQLIQGQLGFAVTSLPIGDDATVGSERLVVEETRPSADDFSADDISEVEPPRSSPAVMPGVEGTGANQPVADPFAPPPLDGSVHEPSSLPADELPDWSYEDRDARGDAIDDRQRAPADDREASPSTDVDGLTVGTGGDEATMIGRLPRPSGAGDDVAPSRRRLISILATMVSLGVLVGGLVIVAPWSSDDDDGETSSATTVPEITADGSAIDTAALAPADVSVYHDPDSGGWLLGWVPSDAGSGQHVIFIKQPDADWVTEVVTGSATSHIVRAPVGPDDPACFVVGTVVFGASEGSTPTADAAPVCVNGAEARDVPAPTVLTPTTDDATG